MIKAFKHFLEKGQMIVTDIFSSSHDIFFFFGGRFQQFYKYLIYRLQMLTSP